MFKDKIAIVTGGGSGIGRCLASALATRGACVVVADVNLAAAEQTAAGIAKAGGTAQAVEVDVSSAEEMQSLVDQTVARHGRLDYMFNNAGTTVIGEMRDLDLNQWQKVINVNLWGVIHGTHAAYQAMLRQRSGHIVNVASGYGITPGPTLIPYSTSKHAVVGLSQSLRLEAADLGIKVTVVCPGYVRTAMLEKSAAVNVRNQDVLAQIPFPLCSAEKSAEIILRGVERNRRIVAFPFYMRLLTWVYHNLPGISEFLMLRMIRDFRKVRQAESPEAAPRALAAPEAAVKD